jgi:hypothetical protein
VNFADSAEVANVQSGGTELVGGSWKADANSTINLTGAAIATNNADVTLNGAGSAITQMENFDTNGPQGTFRVEGGRVFNTATNLANSGTVEINGAASQINVTNTFTQTGGQTTLNGGTLASLSGPAQFIGGVVNGSGTIMGGADFTGASVIDTGASPGIIAITGDALFDSTIQTELDGVLVDAALPNVGRINAGVDPLTTAFDQINVAGTATLGTNLVIDVTASFSAVHGDFFDVLTADVIVGSLATITLNLPTDFTASIVTLNDLSAGFDRDALRLTYVDPNQVPVPGGLAMMLPALIGGGLFFRRRNKRNAK